MTFYIKSKGSEPRIIMGVHYDRQFSDGRFVYSTKEFIDSKDWYKGFPKKNQAIRSRLNLIAAEVDKFITLNRATLTKGSLKAHLDSLAPKEVEIQQEKTLLAEWDDFIKIVKETREHSTYLTHCRTRDLFRESISDINPKDFNQKVLQRYHIFLSKNFEPNTVAKYIKRLVTFLTDLNSRIKVFVPVGLKQFPGRKISLTEMQLNTTLSHTFDVIEVKRKDGRIRRIDLNEAKILWVLQCATGVRVSDLYRLKDSLKNGQEKFRMETQKIKGTFVEMYLTKPARQALDLCNWEVPNMQISDYRIAIKYIYKTLWPDEVIEMRTKNGFISVPKWQEISSHDAVRTFITISAEKGVPIPSIAKVVGKTERIIYSNYLNISQKSAEEAVRQAWG